MRIWTSPRFKVFTTHSPFSNVLSFWIQMSLNSEQIWLHLQDLFSFFYSKFHFTDISSQAHWQLHVMAMAKEMRQSTDYKSLDMRKKITQHTKQKKVSTYMLHKSLSWLFQALDQILTSIHYRFRNKMIRTLQDNLFSNIIRVYETMKYNQLGYKILQKTALKRYILLWPYCFR